MTLWNAILARVPLREDQNSLIRLGFFPLVNLSNTRPSGVDKIALARIWLTIGSYRLEVTSYLGSVGAWLSEAEI
jgi:hypothetical protein